MSHFDCKILILLFLLSSCKNGQVSDGQLVVTVEHASLREAPNEKSREIASLRAGQNLSDLGEVSQFETQVRIANQLYQTPWIQVETSGNEKGWALAAALRPVQQQQDWLLKKRLVCYFGKTLAARRDTVLQNATKMENEAQLCDLWHVSTTLRDTFLTLLMRRPESGVQLQFDWLNEVLPGFLFQKVGDSNRPYLFANFDFWQQKAVITNGLQDDFFFQTCLVAFPQDSIESFFPVWKFPLSDSETASQLGAGQHKKMFQQIDIAMETGSLFARDLEAFKNQILEDIFDKKVRYWQSSQKILEELGQILEDPPACLDAREREALEIRRKMFENPAVNGILVNLRSGE